MGTLDQGIYIPSVGETGWGGQVSQNFSYLADLGFDTWQYDATGTIASTLNIRARGGANSKALIRVMPQGTGEVATGDRAELTLLFEDVDTANRGWVDMKVRQRASDSVRFFHWLTDRVGTANQVGRFVVEFDPNNIDSANEFAIVRDAFYDSVESGSGAWMFRIQQGSGITRIESGTIKLAAGNLVFGTSAGDTVVDDDIVRPFATNTTDLGTSSFKFKQAFFAGVVDASGGIIHDVVATGSLPAAGAGMNGRVLIEDAGAGNRNLIIYAGGERFRIDGGAAF